MRSLLVTLMGASLIWAPSAMSAVLADPSDVPAACQEQPVDWAACAAAAETGSPLQYMAYMHLGTQAFMRQDFDTAVAFYDLTEGQSIMSDAFFHAYRAGAYRRVGRGEESAANAALAWRWLQSDTSGPEYGAWTDDERDHVLVYLIKPMFEYGVDGADDALAMYLSLPIDDWIAAVNRAGTLTDIGQYDAALANSEAALAMQPGHPAVQNNHCYILTLVGRAEEALGYCERAFAMLANATVHSTYSRALAAVGRCEESEVQRASGLALAPSLQSLAEPFPCTPR